MRQRGETPRMCFTCRICKRPPNYQPFFHGRGFFPLFVMQSLPQGTGLILFSNSTDTSARAFSLLASAHSTQRSAATPRSIPVSQNEKFASHFVPFSFENRKYVVTSYLQTVDLPVIVELQQTTQELPHTMRRSLQ